jgi:TusA-related sulfurtransferase
MTPTNTNKMDLRGLEPPEPMMRILEALSATPTSATLEAKLERRPMFLLEELTRRGQPYTCTQCDDGSWLINIPIAQATPASSPPT